MTVTEKDHVWVTLTDDQIAFCDRWANKRQGNAERADLKGHNNAPEGHDEALELHVIGLRGECPLYLHWGGKGKVSWSYNADKKAIRNGIADLEGFIDVKTRRQKDHRLMVQVDDPPDWAYVLVCAAEHPRYCIIGWCWGHEAQQEPITDPKGGRPAHFISEDDPRLKPISELHTEVLRRQAEAAAPETFAPGFVGYNRAGHFVHYCQCGVWGGFGYGVSVRTGKLGTWYCAEHNPERKSHVRTQDGAEGNSNASYA